MMTAFQKAVEMPLTGRDESYAPARFAKKVLPVAAETPQGRRKLNYAAHSAIGAMWGAAFGVAGRINVHGQKAVHIVFPAVFSGDVITNTALGLYEPWNWSPVTGGSICWISTSKLKPPAPSTTASSRRSCAAELEPDACAGSISTLFRVAPRHRAWPLLWTSPRAGQRLMRRG